MVKLLNLIFPRKKFFFFFFTFKCVQNVYIWTINFWWISLIFDFVRLNLSKKIYLSIWKTGENTFSLFGNECNKKNVIAFSIWLETLKCGIHSFRFECFMNEFYLCALIMRSFVNKFVPVLFFCGFQLAYKYYHVPHSPKYCWNNKYNY